MRIVVAGILKMFESVSYTKLNIIYTMFRNKVSNFKMILNLLDFNLYPNLYNIVQ